MNAQPMNRFFRKLKALYLFTILPFVACDDKGQANTDEVLDMAVNMMDIDMEAAATCPWTEDGVCDEPHACPLGSDQVDCNSACDDSANSSALLGVCLWRERGQEGSLNREVLTGLGSRGSGGAYGHISGALLTLSGEDSSRDVARHYRAYVPRSYRAEIPAR